MVLEGEDKSQFRLSQLEDFGAGEGKVRKDEGGEIKAYPRMFVAIEV